MRDLLEVGIADSPFQQPSLQVEPSVTISFGTVIPLVLEESIIGCGIQNSVCGALMALLQAALLAGEDVLEPLGWLTNKARSL